MTMQNRKLAGVSGSPAQDFCYPMTPAVLRKWMIECHKSVLSLTLSRSQVLLFRTVRYLQLNGEVTSSEVGKTLRLSTQCASTRLKTLVRKGYLTRHNLGSPTGGNLYEYRCAV